MFLNEDFFMIDLHLSAFAPRWRFLYVVRIDAYGPVDKSKNSAGTHSGSSRTVNLEIAKDGIYHPLEV